MVQNRAFPRISSGATIGVFSPSTPGAVLYPELYEEGLRYLRSLGFRIVEGELTAKRVMQGHRAASARERAQEFLSLYTDSAIDGLMAVLGGTASASLLPHIPDGILQKTPKMVCGFSDVTAIHLALWHAGVGSYYGPSLIRSFGRDIHREETARHFLQTVTNAASDEFRLMPFSSVTARNLQDSHPRELSPDWTILVPGSAEGFLFAANLNTLLRAAGTKYFPSLRGAVLFIEEMNLPLSKWERNFRQLQLMGVLDDIAGLVISKPEAISGSAGELNFVSLTHEILLDSRGNYPVLINFDAGHTYPMYTLPLGAQVLINTTNVESLVLRVIRRK